MPRIVNRFTLLAFALAALLPPAPARAAAAPGPHEGPMVVKAARVYVLGKTLYLEDAWMVIRDGRIERVGTGPVGEDLPVVDFGRAFILPGLISTHSRLSGGRDDKGLGARYVAADRFNPYADFGRAWRYGITSARLSPPVNRFIGGVGSVVKLGRDGEQARVLRRVADLLVNFNDEGGRDEEAEATNPTPSSSDVRFEPSPLRRPLTRLGRIEALQDVLRRTREQAGRQKKGWYRDRGDFDAKLGAFAAFLATERPLRIDARRAVDILQAVEAVSKTKARAYINGADEALLVADAVAGAKIPVVIEYDNQLDEVSDDGFNPVRPWRRDERTAAELERRGVEVVIGGDGDDLLLAAAMAVAGGMSEKAALAAITVRPARLLGIADRTGSLEAGKHADFAVINGEPLSSTSHVQEVWVEGVRAWGRHERGGAVVIRAGKIYDGTGRVVRDGEVLIDGGKIVACGPAVARPKNAVLVDAGRNAVVTPGFIDAHGHLGLEGDRTVVATDVPVADALAVARADFRDVARAGVTTVVVAPERVNKDGAQLAAIKTAGANPKELLVKRMAGIKLDLFGSSLKVEKSLEKLLKRAGDYHEKWVKYEGELAKWKAAQSGEAPPPAKDDDTDGKEADEADDGKPADDDLSGTWKGTLTGGPLPAPESVTMKVRLRGKRVAGTITNPLDTSDDAKVSGTFDGTNLSLTIEYETPFGEPTLTAKLDKPESLVGSISVGGVLELDFKAKRTSKAAPAIKITSRRSAAAASAKTKKPKKPKLDPKLEPWRTVLSGKAGVLVRARTPGLLRVVARLFGERKLPVIFLDATGIHRVLDELKDKVSVVLPKGLTRTEDRRPVLISGELDRAGVDVAFQSDGAWGASKLPRLARSAVHEGLSAETALKALTYNAARMLKMDDTVGSLQKGRDGDVLIFDGEPFDMRTRLISVFIRGKEVK